MLGNLLRQQARLALFPRVFFSPSRQCKRHTVITTQRALFLSRASLQEEQLPVADKPDPSGGVKETSSRQTQDTSESTNTENCSVLWIANLHWRAGAEEVCEVFRQYGTVKSIHFPRDDRGLKSGRAFLEFSTPEEANRVFESSQQEPFLLRERLIRIEFAKNPPRAWIPDHDNIRPNNTLHVANYPFPGDEASVLAWLHKYVTRISKIHFMKDNEGQPTGKTFITFRRVEDAHNVLLQFQGSEVGGVKLLIFYAHQRSDRSSGRL